MKEMTGALPFGVIRHCGCVFSEGGIKAVIVSTGSGSGSGSGSDSSSPKIRSEDVKPSTKFLPCPNCSEPFDPSEGFGSGTGSAWWLPLNPKPEHQTQMLHDLNTARAAAKAAKKSSTGGKKRKSEAVPSEPTADAPSSNKRTKSSSEGQAQGPTRLSGKVHAELAELEAKRKAAGMSDAVKSIYAGKNGSGGKLTASGNDFFSRTFNRVSRGSPWTIWQGQSG